MCKGVFVNFSNHPSCKWSEEQRNAANALVPKMEIVDLAFPAVDSEMDEAGIQTLTKSIVDKIMRYHPAVVMCQGEFGLTYSIVNMLKKRGVKVVYSCSERKTIEKQTTNGTEKLSVFSFVRFREY